MENVLSGTGRILESTLGYIEVPRSNTKGRGEYEVTVNAELTRTVIYTATAQEEMLRSKTPSAKHRILASKAQCRIEYKRSAGTESSNHATTQSTHNHPALSIVYWRSSFCEISLSWRPSFFPPLEMRLVGSTSEARRKQNDGIA